MLNKITVMGVDYAIEYVDVVNKETPRLLNDPPDLEGRIWVMNEAYKRLGLKKIKDKQYALRKSLGGELFLAYSDNETEQLAWCYEKTLHGKGSEFGNVVRSIMKGRYGIK